MGLLNWLFSPPPRTPPPHRIARPGGSQGPQTDDSDASRLNQLETRVERLELDNAERQLAVLTAIEKVMHQLRARERKRARDGNGDEPEGEEVPGAPAAAAGGHYPTAALARRFRRF